MVSHLPVWTAVHRDLIPESTEERRARGTAAEGRHGTKALPALEAVRTKGDRYI